MKNDTRRSFLKHSAAIGTGITLGAIGLAGCYGKKHQSTKEQRLKTDAIDFSHVSYCCFDCHQQCPLYKATINNDDNVKIETAKEWGDFDKPGFKLEEYYCYGCKDQKSRGIPCNSCKVKECAVKKGLATCAQCGDFESCDQELWKLFPQMRDDVRKMKAKLGLT